MGKIEDFVKKVYEKSQSRKWWVFETPEWSFVDGKEKVLIKGKKYNLSNILCNDVTSAELKNMTDKVLDLIATKKGLNKSTIAKIKVTGVSVHIYFEGEDENDWRSGNCYTLSDIYDMCELKKPVKSDNPFREYQIIDKGTGMVIKPEWVALNATSILSELKYQGFELLLKQHIISREGQEEYYYLLVHNAGVIVTLNDIKGFYPKLKGSMFIICNGNSKNLHSILKEWDGGGNCFRKNIYLGITNELRKAYDLSDVKWVCELSDSSVLSSFCIYSGADCLEYLGGSIREENGGDNKCYMLDDAFSSVELSMYCSYYENMVIFNKISQNKLKVPVREFNKCYNDRIAAFKEKYPSECYLMSECAKRIDEAYGVTDK